MEIFKNYLLVGWLYFILATGKVLPVDSDGSLVHIMVGGLNLYLLILFSFANRKSNAKIISSLYILMPLMSYFLIQLVRSDNIIRGIEKIEGAFFVTIFVSGICYVAVKKLGDDKFFNIFLVISMGVLFLTFIQRYNQNLSDRSGYFLLNGPIVFGWLMGFNSLLSFGMFLKNKKIYHVIFAFIFFLAVLWSQSKGPLISLVFVAIVMLLRGIKINKLKENFKIIFPISFFVLAAFIIAPFYIDFENSRLIAIYRIIGSNLISADDGSISVRYEMLIESYNIFLTSPLFGIGLSNWIEQAPSFYLNYPHNIIAEILVEHGIIGGLILTFTVIYLLKASNFRHGYYFLFFALCLMLSGDASYWRFLFFMPMIFQRFR